MRSTIAKANGLEPWAYINHLFEHLPSAKAPDAVEALLPFHLKMDNLKTKASIPSFAGCLRWRYKIDEINVA